MSRDLPRVPPWTTRTCSGFFPASFRPRPSAGTGDAVTTRARVKAQPQLGALGQKGKATAWLPRVSRWFREHRRYRGPATAWCWPTRALLARAEAATQAVRHPLISRAGPATSLVQGQPPAWCWPRQPPLGAGKMPRARCGAHPARGSLPGCHLGTTLGALRAGGQRAARASSSRPPRGGQSQRQALPLLLQARAVPPPALRDAARRRWPIAVLRGLPQQKLLLAGAPKPQQGESQRALPGPLAPER
jgi:hypothetical protein